jgi:hypothetical protein
MSDTEWRNAKTDPKRDIYQQQGMMMAEIQELKGRLMIVEGQMLRLMRPKMSIRPQVQTAGISSIVAGIIVGIFELVRAVGLFH